MLIVLTICYLSEPLNFFSCKELFFVKAIIQHLELILVNLSPLSEKFTLISRKIYLSLKMITFSASYQASIKIDDKKFECI